MTELIWEGKYIDGKKTSPVRLALPFQDVETVNESAQIRTRMLDLWNQGEPGEWRNRLIWGDKKYVLPSLLPEFAGKVDLIYIDPPFNADANFSFQVQVEGSAFIKEPSIIEQKAYRDTWGKGLDSYLQWFYETATLLQDLLASGGSLYVHLDWHVGHYAKSVLDEVFGVENFRNEIVWKRSAIATNVATQWRNSHDTLFFYTKSANATFHVQYGEYSGSSKKHFAYEDEKGVFQPVPLLGSGKTERGETGQAWRGIDPNVLGKNGMHWLKKPAVLDELDQAGMIYWPEKGGLPRLKYYLHEAKGVYVSDFWDDINIINSMGSESIGYPTQKPEALLERIINASSNPGDLVLDCFCGSGTTAAVAEKLGRRWITCDLGRYAIHTARKRLLAIDEVKPFVVQNLGKYERQAWQSAEFGDDTDRAALAQASYRRFILDLYGAEPIEGYTWLHGVKAGRLVHVGSVDAPVLLGDVQSIAREFWKAAGQGSGARTNSVDVLGWDFAFELNEMGKQMAADANIGLAFKRIPREVLERKAVEQGDIRFFELAALSADVNALKGKSVKVELSDFVVHPDDMPEEVQRAITHWSQLIDYWAVDWDYRGDTFHNQWQSYRTRKSPRLQTTITHTYDEPGTYTIVIKVIDILGNDTTKSIVCEVK